MCGIAGSINFNNINVKRIHKSLFHRGPDNQTELNYKNLHLIHTRLSIQDLKHGDQPLTIGNYTIIFNGEIYNHLELRKKLNNFIFRTSSDTETLLVLYIEFGISALEMCDGMFAFAILDRSKNKLILARDRVGKKPLYLYKNSRQLFFASELNTVLASVPNLTIDEDAIYSYLRSGFLFKETTPYNDVEEILPGSFIDIDIGTLKIEKSSYFSLIQQYENKIELSENESILKLESILHDSIKDRLLSSELDVGSFLSGGIDSSLIVAIASQYVEKLKTFTVKFEGSYDESPIAKLTADKYNTKHHELSVSMDLKNDVEKILSFYGEPFMDSSAIPSYYISREAKKHVTVVLNGDGADELFGGYRRYVPIANNWIKYVKYFSILKSIIPHPHNKQNNYNYIYRLISMSNKRGLDFYLSATTDLFEDVYQFQSNSVLKEMESYVKSVNKLEISELSKILIQDSSLILQSDLLKKMDIATMSNSLEGRSPFLSKYMLEWAPTIPDKLKINGTQTKYILRRLAQKYSLNQVFDQPKRGFEVPLREWVEKDLKENIFDSLKSNSYSSSYIESKFINKMLQNKIVIPREKRAKILWDMYALEVWHKNYLKNSLQEIKPIESYVNYKKINILFLTTGLGLGGAERVVLDICKNINKSKFNVKVIGISSQNDLLKEFRSHSIQAKVLSHRKDIRSFISSLKIVFATIKTDKIDIIHAHMFHTLILASLIKIFLPSVSVVFTPHNNFIAMAKRRWLLWFLRPFRTVDTVFSEDTVRFFHKKPYNVIPNGIDVKKYSDSSLTLNVVSRDIFTFVIVGRLEFMKNHTFLIDIISQLEEYDFCLKIVGTGLLEKSLKSKVSELSLDKKIQFLGAREDVPLILNNSDCLLLPSLWEAFPIVLLEAAACNIPVIATPVGSIPSLINNENGYIVELNMFKDSMIDVLENYSNAKNKSKKMFNKVHSDFQIKDIVHQYESLYTSLLE